MNDDGSSDISQLQQTLDEEKEADQRLNEIAEGMVNQRAAQSSEQEEEGEAVGAARGRGNGRQNTNRGNGGRGRR